MKTKNFVVKFIYFAIGLIVVSNLITSYSTLDEATGIVTFAMNDFDFELDPLIYSSADFINNALTSGLLVVLVTIQKIQQQKEVKNTMTIENKQNLILEAQVSEIIKERKVVKKSTELTEAEKNDYLDRTLPLMEKMIDASNTTLNENDISIQDLISRKLKQKDVLTDQLNTAIKNNDTTIVSILNKGISRLGAEISKLQKKTSL